MECLEGHKHYDVLKLWRRFCSSDLDSTRNKLSQLQSTAGIYRPGGGTVSISLPAKTGAECGLPSGEPPACSTVTA